MSEPIGSQFRLMYGPPILGAIAKGDLAEMKALAKEAEQYLHHYGDVSAALEALKVEIAKLEAKH
jgi:phage shock protein A